MAQQPTPSPNDDFWIFGYGSLIWKPPPHFDRREPGYIEGYVRRFWQASEDHRGTPSHPGRVVTLISYTHYSSLVSTSNKTANTNPLHRVWGAAYHIPSTHIKEVQEYLDIREINGYSIQYTTFYPSASSNHLQKTIEKVMVYIGLPSNPQFLGPQDQDALARRIVGCRGPSGENQEYLFMLRDALRDLGEGAGDAHVEDLAGRVEGLVSGEITGDGSSRASAVEGEVERVRSGENGGAVEETEKS